MKAQPAYTFLWVIGSWVTGVLVFTQACNLSEALVLPIAGDYQLVRINRIVWSIELGSEPSTADDFDGPGVLNGPIEQLGWSDRYIIAEVRRGGWRIIDVSNRRVSGVLSREEVAQQQGQNSELGGIRVYGVEEAAKQLRRRTSSS